MGGPIILAVRHSVHGMENWTQLRKAKQNLSEFLTGLAGERVKRTLFIEGAETTDYFREDVRKIMAECGIVEPFSTAIEFAEQKGWTVVPLDKKSVISLMDAYTHNPHPEDKLDDSVTYLMYNRRERNWAHRTRNAKDEDIIIIHPSHVKGYLAESGLDPRRVVWINRPPRHHYYERMRSDEVERFLQERAAERTSRRGANLGGASKKMG